MAEPEDLIKARILTIENPHEKRVNLFLYDLGSEFVEAGETFPHE